MLIIYSKQFKLSNLKNQLKNKKIKKYSKLNKTELLELLNYNSASIYIQRFIRNRFNNDDNCPITLFTLTYPFVSIKNYYCQDIKFRYYSLNEFVEYLIKCPDDFKDPFSREILSDSTIIQIENLIKFYKIKKIFNKSSWKRKIAIRAEYLTITNCINDIINDIFYMNSLSIDIIYSHILPQFIYYFHFLLLNHKSNCFSLINNYINCINNHPSEHKEFLIDYLKLVISVNNL